MIRQFDHLVVVGAPTSAAAATAGVERAPAALRAAGLLERLREAGYQVTDTGDLAPELSQPDPDNPRAKNLSRILAALEAMRTRLEQAIKTRGIPLVLGGDASVTLPLAAALRRQSAALGFVYLGRHARFHTPAATEDGLVEPMVVSLLVGQGPAELVRYWNEPPLVREPDLALFGFDVADAAECERLDRSAIRCYRPATIRKKGVRPAVEAALESVRAPVREFVVHVELDAIGGELSPRSEAGEAGASAPAGRLSPTEWAEALACLLAPAKLAGLSLSGYNPALDAEARGASEAVELIVTAMTARLRALRGEAAPVAAAVPAADAEVNAAPPGGSEAATAAPGESAAE
jgi:arginase